MNKTSCLSLFAALWLASTTGYSAEAPATAAGSGAVAPVENAAELEELEEVVVRGQRVQEAIVDAEDDFYKLYNQLNKDTDYDVNCTYLNNPDRPGSQIKMRLCIPVFVANAMADYNVWKVRCQPPLEGFDEFDCLDRNDDNRLSRQEAAVRPELDVQLMTLDEDRNGYLSRDELPEEGFAGGPIYQPPSPDLVLMEGTQKWYRHMMSVIKSDERLGEQAGKLDDLYRELRMTQQRVYDIEENQRARREKATHKPAPR